MCRRILNGNRDGLVNNYEGMIVHRGPLVGGGRSQRLLTLRLILEGAEVLRVLIHLPPLILRRQGSWFCS